MNVSKVAKKGLLYTQTGTPYYASPEVWRDQPYDHKSDIWSLGCVIYEAITLKPPFRAEDMQGLYKKVLKGQYPKIPNIFSTDLSALVKFLIQVPPKMRPDCDQILELPIVQHKMQQLFPEDFFYETEGQNFNLLSTIRVPKNLLYLTDKLPKPNYSTESGPTHREAQELIKRKTVNGQIESSAAVKQSSQTSNKGSIH
jgi:NIMA (never in mitosis gene a)-related kinase